MSDRRCLVAICHNWPVLFTKTARSLMEIGWGDRVEKTKVAHGFTEISHAWYFRSPRVDALRNAAAQDAVTDGFTHLVFLDADMIWPSDVLLKLLSHHDRGIVSGLYFLKHPPYAPVALRDGHERDGSELTWYQHDREYGLELREEEVVGLGCAILPVSIFTDVAPPWFRYQRDAEHWPIVSEDVPFCRAARAAGYRVWLDPTIKCGHVGIEVIDERYHRRYQASEAATLERSLAVSVTEPPGSAA